MTRVRIAGHFVAAFQQYSGREGADVATNVFDVRAGRRVRTETDGEPQTGVCVIGIALVLKADGAAGWMVENRVTANGRVISREVRKADGTGYALLDRGVRLNPKSLAVRRSILLWTDDGQRRSTRLQ